MRWINHRGKTYYYYNTFDNLKEAVRYGKYYKKKIRSNYLIVKVEKAFGEDYELYLSKLIKFKS